MKKLTPKQQQFRKSLLCDIHTSQKWHEYFVHYRDAYEEMLDEAFGVTTAAKLSIDKLLVLRDFLKCKRNNLVVSSSTAQQNYILELWKQKARDPSAKNLRALIKHKVGKTVLYLSALSQDEAKQVIAIINNI